MHQRFFSQLSHAVREKQKHRMQILRDLIASALQEPEQTANHLYNVWAKEDHPCVLSRKRGRPHVEVSHEAGFALKDGQDVLLYFNCELGDRVAPYPIGLYSDKRCKTVDVRPIDLDLCKTPPRHSPRTSNCTYKDVITLIARYLPTSEAIHLMTACKAWYKSLLLTTDLWRLHGNRIRAMRSATCPVNTLKLCAKGCYYGLDDSNRKHVAALRDDPFFQRWLAAQLGTHERPQLYVFMGKSFLRYINTSRVVSLSKYISLFRQFVDNQC